MMTTSHGYSKKRARRCATALTPPNSKPVRTFHSKIMRHSSIMPSIVPFHCGGLRGRSQYCPNYHKFNSPQLGDHRLPSSGTPEILDIGRAAATSTLMEQPVGNNDHNAKGEPQILKDVVSLRSLAASSRCRYRVMLVPQVAPNSIGCIEASSVDDLVVGTCYDILRDGAGAVTNAIECDCQRLKA
jgi:hypothetical protein